jgi:hypothetical protein
MSVSPTGAASSTAASPQTSSTATVANAAPAGAATPPHAQARTAALGAPFGHVLASALANAKGARLLAGARLGKGLPGELAGRHGGPHRARGEHAGAHVQGAHGEHGRHRDLEDGDAGDGDEASAREHDRASLDGADALDPAARNAALLAPPPFSPALAAAAPSATNAPRARMSMEELLPALVKRIAWAGDRHSGTVRLEIGAGAYAGTTLLVHADAGRVRVEVSGAEGADLDALRSRLDARLRGHGLDVESVS